MSKPRVAILGLGLMGSGMAGRLLAAKFPLTVYNRNRERSLAFEADGAFVARSPREAASRAEVVLSIVADDSASRSIWLGEDGALAGASPDSILIESGTLTVGWIKELAAKAAALRCRFLDAPVTGSKPQAAQGELRFLVGGSAADLEAARPVLSVLSQELIHLGPTGSGATMKLVNNFLCGIQVAALAESLSFIDAAGLNREQALGILSSGAPGSPIVKRVSERVRSRDFTPHFALRWMAKDLSYAMAGAAASGVALPIAATSLAAFERAIAEGYGEEDFAALTKSKAQPGKS